MPRTSLWLVALFVAIAAPSAAGPDDGANVHPLDEVDPDPAVKAVLAGRQLRCPGRAVQRLEVDSQHGRIWCEMPDGAEHGPYELWSASGTLLETGERRAGVLHGTYREWWNERTPAVEARFVDGVPDGAYRAWDDAGGLVERGAYRGGRRHGVWRQWRRDAGDALYAASERGYYYGAAHGRWWSRDPRTGVLYDVRFHRGRLHGRWRMHLDDLDGGGELDIEGAYEDGRRHGRWRSRERQDRDGPRTKQVIARFDHGAPHGRWELWTDGALTAWTEYRAGRRTRDDDTVPSERDLDFEIDDVFDEDPLRGRW